MPDEWPACEFLATEQAALTFDDDLRTVSG